MDIDRDWNMWIGGEFVDADEQFDVLNPATGNRIASAPSGTAEDIDRAVAAARDAFEEWRWTSPQERTQYLFDFAEALEAEKDELTQIELLENGKPLSQAARDVRAGIKYCRFYGGGTDKFYGDAVRDSIDAMYKKVFEPYGVVGVVIPWNWPPLHTMQFVSLAMAAGNTVVLKPAPETPISSLRIAELLSEVCPDGALNIVSGATEPGQALTSHPDVDKVAFTGNDKTGEKVLAAAGSNITSSMLELGGKNPEIIFPDADLDKAITATVRNCFFNSGQACSDTERLLLHTDIHDEYLDRLVTEAANLSIGNGRDDPHIGPMISEAHREKVQSYVTVGTEEGATVAFEGETPTDPELEGGNWVAPTIFSDVDPDMRIAQEEIFGPVVSVIEFETEEEAVEIANDVNFGLTGTIWTKDIERAHRMAYRIEAGTVAINNLVTGRHALPFGGYKRSGIGRKSDFVESMHEFSRVKSIHADFSTDRFDFRP